MKSKILLKDVLKFILIDVILITMVASMAMVIWWQAGKIDGLKAIPVATCPTPIVTAEQLEQAGFQLDKLIQFSIKQE